MRTWLTIACAVGCASLAVGCGSARATGGHAQTDIYVRSQSVQIVEAGSSGAPPSSDARPYAQPPFLGRAYFGWTPFEFNDLCASLWVSDGPTAYELHVDGQPVDIVINGSLSQATVVRGAHVGQTVSVLPGQTPPYGTLQFDAPGQHGFDVWCYTNVPGVGLTETGHRAYNVQVPLSFNHQIRCD